MFAMKKIFYSLLCVLLLPVFCNAQSWTPQGQGILPYNFGIIDLSAVDENTVWALASIIDKVSSDSALLIKSTNGGADWEVHPLKQLANRSFVSLAAVNDSTAWLTAYSSRGISYFYQTTDGGADWALKYTVPGSFTAQFAPVLKFSNEQTAHYVGIWPGKSGKTTNGGTTWSAHSIPNFFNDEYWGVACPQNWLEVLGDTLWFGTSKRIFRSTNGGQNWQSIYPDFPGNNQITSVAFDHSGNGLAISDNDLDLPWITGFLDHTILWKSEDFGATWALMDTVGMPLTSMTRVPEMEKTFVAVSGFGGWYEPLLQHTWVSVYTTDGGITWNEIDRGIPYHGVDFVSPQTGWAGAVGNYDYGPDKPALFKWNGQFTTSVSNPNQMSVLSISPNPATDFIAIQSPELISGMMHLSIFDSQGRLTNRTFVTGGQLIDVSDLMPGIYAVKVVADERAYAGRFIKQ